jgi:hypothetical protein
MGMTGPANTDFNSTTPEVTHSPTGMHRPEHSEFDTEETACQDEVLHDAALRDSVLRTPR